MISLHLRATALLFVAISCCRADETAARTADEEAVQREIARLDSIKPRPSIRPLNNISFSYQLGMNIRTTFKGFGAFRANNAGPATSGINHEYDDGYNRVDAQGNDHSDQGFPHTTTFWGYHNSSQWNHDNNTVEMHSAFARPIADVSNDDPRHGFQFLYERIICGHEKWYLGVEVGFGFTKIDITENKTVTSPVYQTTDAYAIPPDPLFGGYSIPAAPYNGPFSGDLGTSLLSDIPIRSIAATGDFTSVMSTRHVDANLWRMHLGPKLHVPVHRRLELEMSGGLAVAIVDSEFNFQERVFLPASLSLPDGAMSTVARGSGNNVGTLVGGYLSGNLVYPLWPDSKMFVGGQWEDLGTYRHYVASHLAEVDFTGAVSFMVGMSLGY